MNLRITNFISLISLGAALMLPATHSFAMLAQQSAKIDQSPFLLNFPRSLPTYIHQGSARVAVSIDREGKLKDYLVIGYTDIAFADATVEAIKRWSYEPAIYANEPVSVVSEIHCDFDKSGSVEVLNLSEMVSLYFSWWKQYQMEYHPIGLKELDRIPVPVHVVTPIYPSSLAKAGVIGDVTVTFYIDEQGQIRMPAVSSTTEIRLADMAVDALNQWKFEPPTSRGKPVLVKAVQTFKFKNGTVNTAN